MLEIKKLAPSIGAEITNVDLSQELPAQTITAIREAWLDNLVLVFRGQQMSDAELVTFSSNFGDLDKVPGWEPFAPEGFPEVLIISNVTEAGAEIGVLGDGEAAWHTDMSYISQPPPASLLFSLEIPPSGGDTHFMNMYAVLDALPENLRAEISGKNLNHDSSYDSSGKLRANHQPVRDVSKAPGAHHPMICDHPETGRAALYLGRRRNAHVVGESVADSDALLDNLWELCEREEFTYRHRWRQGDLVMWDNRCTMHRRDPFDPSARRIMHRTQIKGDTKPSPALMS